MSGTAGNFTNGRAARSSRAPDGWGRLAAWCGLAALLAAAGCQRAPVEAGAAAPAVNGDDVIFPADAPQLQSLTVSVAQPRTVVIRHLTGRLCWDDRVTARVFTPVAGRVTAVRADIGQSVGAGQALAALDSPDFGQALAAARTAAANLAAADEADRRARELYAHGALAEKDAEAALAAAAAARAERDRAEGVLANYGGNDQSSNETYQLRSPLAGVVVDRSLNPGQELRPDMMLGNVAPVFDPLFTVSDPTRLWVQVDVAEADLRWLETGQALRVHCAAYPGREFAGRVENIGDTLDPATRAAKVRGEVDNPDRRLKAEMYVTVDVLAAVDRHGGGGVEIGAAAVFMQDDRYYLFVETAPGRFSRRLVQVGSEADGMIPIVEGLQAGDRVVTGGALLLQAILNPTD